MDVPARRSSSCVTGVSGSGKTTLVNDIAATAPWRASSTARRRRRRAHETHRGPRAHRQGHRHRPDARSAARRARTRRPTPASSRTSATCSRSCPRRGRAATSPGASRFNVKGGRCEACEGDGIITHRDALPARRVRHLRGLQRQALQPRDAGGAVQGQEHRRRAGHDRRRGAASSSSTSRPSGRKLETLHDVGLGYIKLGQIADHALGRRGAAHQAVQASCRKRATGRTLYILDEPTTGLHFDDVAQLLHVLHRLVDSGNTVVVIEHNLDVIKTAD